MTPHPAVVAIIEDGGRHILAVSRRSSLEDLGLPGGKVEWGESLEMAVRREVYEETGIEIHRCRPIYAAPSPSGSGRMVTAFIVDSWTQVGTPRDGEGAVSWVTRGRLLDERCSFRAWYPALFQMLDLLK